MYWCFLETRVCDISLLGPIQRSFFCSQLEFPCEEWKLNKKPRNPYCSLKSLVRVCLGGSKLWFNTSLRTCSVTYKSGSASFKMWTTICFVLARSLIQSLMNFRRWELWMRLGRKGGFPLSQLQSITHWFRFEETRSSLMSCIVMHACLRVILQMLISYR